MKYAYLPDILQKVLEIIQYQGNSDDFIAKFTRVCNENFLAQLLTIVPEEKKKFLAEAIINKSPLELEQYLDKEIYTELFFKTATNLLQ